MARMLRLSVASKATLEAKLSQLGMDATGNKNALVERLMEASQQTITQGPAAASSQASYDSPTTLHAVHLPSHTQTSGPPTPNSCHFLSALSTGMALQHRRYLCMQFTC